jgi:hypothetical protein
MKSHAPKFSFKSVQVNFNCVCKKHVDGKNKGMGMIVSVGKYNKGRTILFLKNECKRVNVKKYSLTFNGAQIPHASEHFQGTRYSFVFFNK